MYCVAYFLCQLQFPHYSSSSLPIITTSFLSHWNSAWHPDTAHSWHKAQREREREEGGTRTCTIRLVPHPSCLPSLHSVLWTKGPGNPIGISLPLLPVNMHSNFEEFCCQPNVLCVFRDLLINFCVYVVCFGRGINATLSQCGEVSYGLFFHNTCHLIFS